MLNFYFRAKEDRKEDGPAYTLPAGPNKRSHRKLGREQIYKGERINDDEDEGEYPNFILSLAHTRRIESEDESDMNRYYCNVKSMYFIPLLVRLAVEFGCFDEDDEDDEDGIIEPPGVGIAWNEHLI